MFKKCVVVLCFTLLIGFVSCKKSDSDGADPATDQFIEDIFGGDDGGGDFLDDTPDDAACNNNGECDTGETAENCPADCDGTGAKGNNPLPASLKVSTDNNVPPINELKEFIATLEMSNDDHVVSYSYEIVSGDGIIGVDVEEELTEINRIRYLIKGLTPGSAVIQFKATDVDDTEKVFDATLDVEVLKSELKNNSIIEPSTILVDTGMVTLSKIFKGGSGLENHFWDPVVIKQVDSDGVETTVSTDDYTMEKDEDGNEIYTFYIVGNFIFRTKVTDTVLVGYVAESEHPLTVNETVAVPKYVVDLGDPEACMNDSECRRELTSSPETIEYGSGIAILVDGKDTYTCNGGALSEDLELVEEDVYIYGIGTMICLIHPAEDSDDEELIKNNESIDLDSLYSGTKPVSFPSLTFAPNPCAVPSEIVVEKVEIANDDGWGPGQYTGMEGEDLVENVTKGEVKLKATYDQYVKITLKVLNGMGYYGCNGTFGKVMDNTNEVEHDKIEHIAGNEWEITCDSTSHDDGVYDNTVTIEGKMAFERVVSEDFTERLEIQVTDQCVSENTSKKTFDINVTLPTPEDERIGDLKIYADYYTHDIDEYCWIRFRLQNYNYWAGWTKQYATTDPSDDDIHQQIMPKMGDKNSLFFNSAYVDESINYITAVYWHIDDNNNGWEDMNYRLRHFYLMGKYYYREMTEKVEGEVKHNSECETVPLSQWKVCPFPEDGCINDFPATEEDNTPSEYTENGSSDYPDGSKTGSMNPYNNKD